MIEFYSAKACGLSQQMKKHLDKRGVSYRNMDVTQEENYEKLFNLTGQRGFPVTVVNGRTIIGLDTDAVDRAIDSAENNGLL
ncbi:MAG: hypothetical protein J6Y64_06375 [Ruminococcus sp.]|nr:hypothetical protein [Ruminococcus sp.]